MKQSSSSSTLSPLNKAMLDFVPLVLFYVFQTWHGLFVATAVLVGTSLISLTIHYALTRRISAMLVVSSGLVLFFGGLTLIFQDETFIKIKPTFANLFFGLGLLIGLYFKKVFLRDLFPSVLPLPLPYWRKLTVNFSLFFFTLAFLNEIVWRTQTTGTWVNFKVFGLTTLILLFTSIQGIFIYRYLQQGER